MHVVFREIDKSSGSFCCQNGEPVGGNRNVKTSSHFWLRLQHKVKCVGAYVVLLIHEHDSAEACKSKVEVRIL